MKDFSSFRSAVDFSVHFQTRVYWYGELSLFSKTEDVYDQ